MMTWQSKHLAGVSIFRGWRIARTSSDPNDLRYLREFVLKNECAVCHHPLDPEHALAQVGACNTTGAPEKSGFLDWVKERHWDKVSGNVVVKATAQDVMVCDALRCPEGFGLIVWVELDQLAGVAHRLVDAEKIDLPELAKIEVYTPLNWLPFPPIER